jgi:hypothetical protein
MKTYLTAALLPLLTLGAMAQPQAPQAPQTPFQTPALLVEEGGANVKVWLTAATKTAIRYRETEVAVDTKDAKISDYAAIYLYEPRPYSAAMDLFQGRKYEEAKAAFAALKERFKPLQALENNHGTLAAYYEMECLRKLGDLEGLAAALQDFSKGSITREYQLRQLELYVLWDAARSKSWDRLELLTKERINSRLPGDQRAQVAYLHGLAMEGRNQPEQALFAYQTAITADAGASEDIVRLAALRVLAIMEADPEVKTAIKTWGTPDENKNSKGYFKLIEACAISELFEMTLGAGTPLPAEYKMFLKYKPKNNG